MEDALVMRIIKESNRKQSGKFCTAAKLLRASASN